MKFSRYACLTALVLATFVAGCTNPALPADLVDDPFAVPVADRALGRNLRLVAANLSTSGQCYDGGAGLRQLDKNDVTELALGVLRDADGACRAFDLDPLVIFRVLQLFRYLHDGLLVDSVLEVE